MDYKIICVFQDMKDFCSIVKNFAVTGEMVCDA